MEASSSETKFCRHCCQPIHAKARICHHCASSQSWVASYQDSRCGFIWLGIFGLFFILMIFFTYIYEGGSKKKEEEKRAPLAASLTVSNIETRSVFLDGVNEIYVMGEAHNVSNISLSDIVFEVRLYTENNHLADYLLLEQSKLTVPNNGTSNFRIRGNTILDADEIKDIQVKILKAKKANECY